METLTMRMSPFMSPDSWHLVLIGPLMREMVEWEEDTAASITSLMLLSVPGSPVMK